MADFPYTPTPASIKRFLSHIQSAGVPNKVTMKYLEQVGFKSTNDRYLIAILKFIGFVDSSGLPTATWQAYRRKDKARHVLAEAMRRAYTDLFETFPDAHRKDNEALRNYFSAHTKVAEATLGLIVRTFKTLAESADFESPGEVDLPEEKGPALPARRGRESGARAISAAEVPSVNINIQLQLPATDDAAIYDRLFAALKKHLLSD
jgi:Family of unknown function (DUF5343)